MYPLSSSAHIQKRQIRSVFGRKALRFGCAGSLAVLFFVPFLWLIFTAFKGSDEIGAFPIHWLPSSLHWDNFSQAFNLINYAQYTLDSLLLSTISSVLLTTTSAMVGFGFARLHGWGKRPLFTIMLATIMLPPILGVIPSYVLFSRLGLVDTYWPWVLWGLSSSPFFNFLFRQFFAGIPHEIEDAAIVDGCGYFRLFWQIFLPLSKPVVATSLVLSFTWAWGDYLTPLIFLSVDNTTLAVGITTGYADPVTALIYPNIVAAGTIFYILPVVILFFFAQRAFLQGIVTTGMKG